MTEPTEAHRRVTGSADFLAATAIDIALDTVDFPQAPALVRLVLRHGGGPVPTKGKKAVIGEAVAAILHREGLVERVGRSRVTDETVVRSPEDLRGGGTVPPTYSVTTMPRGVSEATGWFLQVTQTGRELVKHHLPPPYPEDPPPT